MSADAVAAPALLPDLPSISAAEERVSVATQWQLVWWRFRKHKLALVSAGILGVIYLVVLFADFLAYADPLASEAQRGLIAPQPIRLFDSGGPTVEALVGTRDPQTFKRVYAPDPNQRVGVRLFAHGFEYRWLGFIPMNVHLLGHTAAQVLV